MVIAYILGIPAVTIGGILIYNALTGQKLPLFGGQRQEAQDSGAGGGLYNQLLGFQPSRVGQIKYAYPDISGQFVQDFADQYKGSIQYVLQSVPKSSKEAISQQVMAERLSGYYTPEETTKIMEEWKLERLGLGTQRINAFVNALKTGFGVEGGVIKVGGQYYGPNNVPLTTAEGEKYEAAMDFLRKFRSNQLPNVMNENSPEAQQLREALIMEEKYRAERFKSDVQISGNVATNRATGQVQVFVPQAGTGIFHDFQEGKWVTVQSGIRGNPLGSKYDTVPYTSVKKDSQGRSIIVTTEGSKTTTSTSKSSSPNDLRNISASYAQKLGIPNVTNISGAKPSVSSAPMSSKPVGAPLISSVISSKPPMSYKSSSSSISSMSSSKTSTTTISAGATAKLGQTWKDSSGRSWTVVAVSK